MAVDSETYMAVCDQVQELRQQLAKSEARVAELEHLLQSHGRNNQELQRILNQGVTPYPPFILRKQAEAVEQAKQEHALTARIPDGTVGEHFQDGFDTAAEQYDTSLDRYAQRLRQQADEAERAGGEHG